MAVMFATLRDAQRRQEKHVLVRGKVGKAARHRGVHKVPINRHRQMRPVLLDGPDRKNRNEVVGQVPEHGRPLLGPIAL